MCVCVCACKSKWLRVRGHTDTGSSKDAGDMRVSNRLAQGYFTNVRTVSERKERSKVGCVFVFVCVCDFSVTYLSVCFPHRL